MPETHGRARRWLATPRDDRTPRILHASPRPDHAPRPVDRARALRATRPSGDAGAVGPPLGWAHRLRRFGHSRPARPERRDAGGSVQSRAIGLSPRQATVIAPAM